MVLIKFCHIYLGDPGTYVTLCIIYVVAACQSELAVGDARVVFRGVGV